MYFVKRATPSCKRSGIRTTRTDTKSLLWWVTRVVSLGIRTYLHEEFWLYCTQTRTAGRRGLYLKELGLWFGLLWGLICFSFHCNLSVGSDAISRYGWSGWAVERVKLYVPGKRGWVAAAAPTSCWRRWSPPSSCFLLSLLCGRNTCYICLEHMFSPWAMITDADTSSICSRRHNIVDHIVPSSTADLSCATLIMVTKKHN